LKTRRAARGRGSVRFAAPWAYRTGTPCTGQRATKSGGGLRKGAVRAGRTVGPSRYLAGGGAVGLLWLFGPHHTLGIAWPYR